MTVRVYWRVVESVTTLSTVLGRHGSLSITRPGQLVPYEGTHASRQLQKVPTDWPQFYLPPLPQRKLPSMSLPRLPGAARLPRLDTPGEDGADAEKREMDELDLQVERRREIYRFGLYAKVRSLYPFGISGGALSP